MDENEIGRIIVDGAGVFARESISNTRLERTSYRRPLSRQSIARGESVLPGFSVHTNCRVQGNGNLSCLMKNGASAIEIRL